MALSYYAPTKAKRSDTPEELKAAIEQCDFIVY